jgi:ABC-type polysaccharide/polyol phosphate transport system ATPase subunit
MPAALKFENVSKCFNMRVRHRTFLQWLRERNRVAATGHFWALRDISFEIKRGDKVALVGHNGAGKTVLLRIASGIFKPTSGKTQSELPVMPLFNFNLGVDQALIVRDYIGILGVVYGLTARAIRERFDAILELSELEPFLNLPARNLSNGQKARLNFSVFIHADYSFLAFDEALSVADSNFCRKAAVYFEKLRNSEKTVIMASHELLQLKTYCQKAIWLDRGSVREFGPVDPVLSHYFQSCQGQG